MMAKMKTLDLIACMLVAVGAINWGLVEFLNTNLVEMIGLFPQVIYGAIDLSGVYALYNLVK